MNEETTWVTTNPLYLNGQSPHTHKFGWGTGSRVAQQSIVTQMLSQSLVRTRAETFHKVPKPGHLVYNEPSSWTYDPDVAALLSTGRNLPLISTIVDSNQVLVDTTLLPRTFMRQFFPEEVEVVLMPGTYIAHTQDAPSTQCTKR